MNYIKKEALALLFLFFVNVFAIKAFAIPNFYTSHDGETHTARLANYYLALKEGQLPPQLAPTLLGGLGFPIFVFIYPLPYLVGSAFHTLGFGYTDSAELVMASGYLLSGLFIYLFFKLETQKTVPSVVASLFFTWAPYRFLMLFVRGAFAESFAYVFVASSLLCLNRLITTKKKHWVGLTALSLAGLLLSHQLVSAMFLPLLTWYFITKLIYAKHKKIHISQALSSLVLAFGIASFIYLPTFFERHYLRFDNLINYYQDHFVAFKQLIRSPWSYGFSYPGTQNDDLSFQLGLTHWVIVALAVASLAIAFLTKRSKALKDQNLVMLLFWLFAFSVAIFVMLDLPLTLLAWTRLPGLSIVDLPWRFLGVATSTVSLMTAYLLVRYKSNPFLVAFLVFFVLYANRNHLRINQSVSFPNNHFENYQSTATWQNEFLPKTRSTNQHTGLAGNYQISSGDANVTMLVGRTHSLNLDVQANTSTQLILHRLYFPGWQVTIDDQLVPIDSESVSVTNAGIDSETGADMSGLIKIDLDSGHHIVSADFKPTQIRRLGLIFSILALGICLLLTDPQSLINNNPPSPK